MFLAAAWQHIIITTDGFRKMSVEVVGLAFIYFILHLPSAKHVSLNCLFNYAQRIERWPANVVCLELQNVNELAFSVSARVFCSVSIECYLLW